MGTKNSIKKRKTFPIKLFSIFSPQNSNNFLTITICLVPFSLHFMIFLISIFFLCLLFKGLMLKPNSEIRKMWAKAPFAVTFKVYIFNITNPMDVMAGGKVCIKKIEIGSGRILYFHFCKFLC